MGNKHSDAMKKRWAEKSPEERSAFASKIAKVKSSKMTRKERSEHGRMMIKKRYNITT